MKAVEVSNYLENIGAEIYSIFPEKKTFSYSSLEPETADEEQLINAIKAVPVDNAWHGIKWHGKMVPVHKKAENKIFANMYTSADGEVFYALICY